MANKKIFISMVLFYVLKECEFAQKLNVAVYYESLCPDSLSFINDQLKPSWNELSPYINLILIPFGKSSSINGGEEFKCQHGPKECIGNKLQSCALSGISDSNARVHFVHCFMNTFSDNNVGHMCAAGIGLNWEYVAQCFHSESGTNLQLQAEAATLKIAPKFVPTIVFNGVFNQDDQDLSLNNFKGVVCKYLQNMGPCNRNYAI